MSISRIQAIETDNNVPKIDIDSTVNNVPKYPVDLQGGGSPIDLQSISITENGTTEAPKGVAYNEVITNVASTTPYEPSLFKIVASLPQTPTDEAIYLIPNGEQVFPSCSTVCDYVIDPYPNLPLIHYVTVCANYTLVGDNDRVKLEDLANITKYWLFDGERTQPHTRYSNGNDITYGSSSRAVPPTFIYEYDTTHPELGWVDITSEVPQEIWDTGNRVVHTTNSVVFSNIDIIRNTSGMEVYTQLYNICDKNGKVSNIYEINTFDIYYIDNGVAVNKGIKKTMLEVYEMLINGQIVPTPTE